MSLKFWSERSVSAWDENQPDKQYTLPIVVRAERDVEVFEEDVFAALAEAMVNMFNDDRWTDILLAWCSGRIRKNVKKARGVKWDELFQHEHYIGRVGNAEVLILKPALLDAIPPYFWKLQGQGIDFPSRGVSFVGTPGFVYAFAPDVSMSSGKKVAQFGHALQVALMTCSYGDIVEWVESGMLCSHVAWFDRSGSGLVEIRDAGFTEIAPNTITVRAYFSV